MRLKGKTAIVTGAGRGIGRAIAIELAKHGAIVLVNDPGVGRSGEETQERPADEVVGEIMKLGGRAEANYDSVADHSLTGQMIEDFVARHGRLDILVNVAGVVRERMIWNMTEDDFDTVIGVHLKGHWNMCHHAIRHMKVGGSGSIINFSSDAFKGSVGQCNYSAAKGGIISLTRSIAKEVARYGITCNVICPSADTRMTLTEAVQENRRKKLASGFITQAEYDRSTRSRGPESIAPLVAFLATDEASHISGQNFHSETGLIHTYFFGEQQKSLCTLPGGEFALEDLIEAIPNALLNGVAPVVTMPTATSTTIKAGADT